MSSFRTSLSLIQNACVFAWVRCLLVLAVPSAPSLCLRHVLFGFDTAEFTVIPRVFVYLIDLAKHSICHCFGVIASVYGDGVQFNF